MRPGLQRKTPKKRSAAKKRAPKARRERAWSRAAPRPRRPREVEIVGMRCRVVEVHPDAEVLVLAEPLQGTMFTVPIVSSARDGRNVRDVSGLQGRDVWLSLRLS